MDRPIPDDFEKAIVGSPLLAPILARWDDMSLPDCWLVAGAVAQTYWNQAHKLPSTHGIKDVDVVYFDADDTSEEAEVAHGLRVQQLFEDLPVGFDVKNEARVHLWYKKKFGYAIRPYTSTKSAIATFPTTAGAIGIQPYMNSLQIYAPFGLEDLLGLIVRPNKTQISPAIYTSKVERWQPIWPHLKIIAWDDDRVVPRL